MSKYSSVVLLVCLTTISLLAHDQLRHQHITREAFKLLKKSFPTQLGDMENFIGNSEVWSGSSADGSFGALKIVSGAWLEDEYDVVYGYGLTKQPDYRDRLDRPIPANIVINMFGSLRAAHTTITHFWNADDGENAYTRLFDDSDLGWWVFTIPENAMQKMRLYANGSYDFIWAYNNERQSWPWCGINSLQLMTKFRVPALIDLYHGRGIFQAFTYFAEDARWYSTDCPTWDQSYSLFQKAHAYEILGRMCHLLEDQSVPAHVHGNAHACTQGMYCDYYENNAPNYDLWTADEIYAEGGRFINPYNSWSDPLYYLMYLMNQATDHYASGRSDGDDNFDPNCPGLAQIVSTLGLPVTQTQVNV